MMHATANSATTSSDAATRQLLETNKSAVGVVMQYLVFVDKVHDMHQRCVVSTEAYTLFTEWALGRMHSICGVTPSRNSTPVVE